MHKTIEGHKPEHRLPLLGKMANELAAIACETLAPTVGAPVSQDVQAAIGRDIARALGQHLPHLVNLHHAAA